MRSSHLSAIASLVLLLGCPSGGVTPQDEPRKDDTGPPGDSEPEDSGHPATGTDLLYADIKLVGEAEGDYAGLGCRMVGDIDGDGLADVFVGAPGSDEAFSDAGKAYLV